MQRLGIPCALLALLVLSSVVVGQMEKDGTEKATEVQSGADPMNYIRKVDFAAIEKSGLHDRFTQSLFDYNSGAKTCRIECIKTPAGSGSPEGLHTHKVDQMFYILKGTMTVEIKGNQYEVGPGTLVLFPAGVPHRNWNRSTEPTLHLSFVVPMPDPHLPFATQVKPQL
jgi:mannose-6-phosphate isomerase-like protein (cupin superfamily)